MIDLKQRTSPDWARLEVMETPMTGMYLTQLEMCPEGLPMLPNTK
jgi:hypothetical protein